MTEQTIKYNIDDNKIAVVKLSRPEVANALNSQMAIEIRDFFAKLPDYVRVVVITGDGEKAFCAGADLKERAGFSVEQWEVQHHLFREVLQSIMDCKVPVIAAVNGVAYGGGLELALACDFIYASENVKFALPEATLGIMCGTGGTQTLPRAVGTRRAREILYTGKSFSAKEAYDFGLVNKICTQNELMGDILSTAIIISDNAPLSITAIKIATASEYATLAEGLLLESEKYKNLLKTDDCKEGLLAFRGKRKTRFSNS